MAEAHVRVVWFERTTWQRSWPRRVRTLIACVSGAAAFIPASGQTDEERERTVTFSAERTEVTRRDSLFVKRYVGKVVATMNPEVWLTAHEATYSTFDHEAVLTGTRGAQATIVDSGRTLRADRVTYLFKEHPRASGRPIAWLRGRVRLEDSSRSVDAAVVAYRPESDSMEAYGRVRARQARGYLTADTLVFDAKNRGVRATGTVEIVDSTEDISIRGGWYRYEERDSLAVVSRQPVLRKGQGDTAVVVRADSMRLEQARRRAVAWGNVQIQRGNLEAVCDSVLYDEKADLLTLYGRPEATQRTESDSTATVSRLFGDEIVLFLDGTNVRRIEVERSARGVATEVGSAGDSLGERWIVGRKIVFHVDGERVTEVEVFGQARSRYMPTMAQRRAEGLNEASGDTIRIAFGGGRMQRVVLRGGVQGVYWPPPDTTSSGSAEPGETGQRERVRSESGGT